MKNTVNLMEAGAFVLEALWKKEPLESCLAKVAAARWSAPAHTGTIRRLVRRDAPRRYAEAAAWEAAREKAAEARAESDRKWLTLPPETKAALLARAAALKSGKTGKSARARFRNALAAHGLQVETLLAAHRAEGGAA